MRLPIYGAAVFCAPAVALCAGLGMHSLGDGQQPHALSAAATSTFAVAGLSIAALTRVDRNRRL